MATDQRLTRGLPYVNSRPIPHVLGLVIYEERDTITSLFRPRAVKTYKEVLVLNFGYTPTDSAMGKHPHKSYTMGVDPGDRGANSHTLHLRQNRQEYFR